MLDTDPTVMLLRSPRSTTLFQMLTYMPNRVPASAAGAWRGCGCCKPAAARSRTRSSRSTSPITTALGATHAPTDTWGTRWPRVMTERWRMYHSSSMSMWVAAGAGVVLLQRTSCCSGAVVLRVWLCAALKALSRPTTRCRRAIALATQQIAAATAHRLLLTGHVQRQRVRRAS
jgi:hypothetical protein